MRRFLFTFFCFLTVLVVAVPAARGGFEEEYRAYFDRSKPSWLSNERKAWVFLQREANRGNLKAILKLADVYWYSANDFMTSYHPDSKITYPDGRIIRETSEAENLAEACRWLKKAAERGSISGLRGTGGCYEKGYGVPKDYDKASEFYRRVMEKGDFDGSYRLGRLYKEKIGDYAKAHKWLKYGIDRGYNYGFYDLGLLYEKGLGVAKDLDKARQLYEQAGKYEYGAKYRLGLMYEEGRGVAKDLAKAMKYYESAKPSNEFGRDAERRLKVIKDGKAEAEERARQARLEEERKKKAAEQKAAKQRRKAAERAERKRVASLMKGLRPTNQYRKVAVSNAAIRTLPERKAKKGRKLQFGEQVHVVAILPSGWVKVAEEGTPVGWIHESALEHTKDTAKAVAAVPQPALEPIDAPYVAQNNANVRAEPNVRSSRVDYLKKGEQVTALGRMAGTKWILVSRAGQEIGYVYESLIAPAEVTKPVASTVKVPAGLDFGSYYALVIGNDAYRNILPLRTAVKDARAVKELLKHKYGFKVTLLKDATRAQILRSLTRLRRTLGPGDNLLIYYAGHGWLDKDADQGYWLPVDAEEHDPTNWISNSSITDALRAIQAKHVLVIADSCYSGKLTRGINVRIRTKNYYEKMLSKKARTVMASGGLEPVADEGGKGKHSVFASALIETLNENQGILDATLLFSKIRRPVMVNADQTPEYSDIRKAGHEGGDFLFVPRR